MKIERQMNMGRFSGLDRKPTQKELQILEFQKKQFRHDLNMFARYFAKTYPCKNENDHLVRYAGYLPLRKVDWEDSCLPILVKDCLQAEYEENPHKFVVGIETSFHPEPSMVSESSYSHLEVTVNRERYYYPHHDGGVMVTIPEGCVGGIGISSLGRQFKYIGEDKIPLSMVVQKRIDSEFPESGGIPLFEREQHRLTFARQILRFAQLNTPLL